MLEVHKRQTPRLEEDLRTECHRSNATCDFYSHCIEPMFPCGEVGFVLDYAQKRCQRLAKFKRDPIMTWAHDSELCFQRKLHNLVKQYHNSTYAPDPSTCLRLEREAIEIMNECYSVGDRLCGTILADNVSEVSESMQQEFQRVMEAVRVGGAYYDSVVDRGVPEMVRQCGHTQLAESLQTLVVNQRVVICAFANILQSSNSENTPSYIINELSEKLRVPHEQFKYSGVDEKEICQINSPDGFNPKEFDSEFHFITWFTNRSNPTVASGDITRYNTKIAGDGSTAYFELNFYGTLTEPQGIRDNSTCGDGIRQAGEECDYTGVESGCNLTCAVVTSDSPDVDIDYDDDSYDCNTERQEPSTCWVEVCGDGARTSHEQCDDGNTMDEDGCSYDCKIEPLHHCTQEYNTTSLCSLIPTIPPPTVAPSPPTLSGHEVTPIFTNTFDRHKDLYLSGGSTIHLVRTSLSSVLLTTLVVLCVTRTLLTQR